MSQFDSKFTHQTPVDSPDDNHLSQSVNQLFEVAALQGGFRGWGGGGVAFGGEGSSLGGRGRLWGRGVAFGGGGGELESARTMNWIREKLVEMGENWIELDENLVSFRGFRWFGRVEKSWGSSWD